MILKKGMVLVEIPNEQSTNGEIIILLREEGEFWDVISIYYDFNGNVTCIYPANFWSEGAIRTCFAPIQTTDIPRENNET